MKLGRTRLAGGLVLSFLTVTCGFVPAFADEELMPGHVAKSKIEQVANDIKWNSDLTVAQEEAKREGKMILWINMIGKMEGAT